MLHDWVQPRHRDEFGAAGWAELSMLAISLSSWFARCNCGARSMRRFLGVCHSLAPPDVQTSLEEGEERYRQAAEAHDMLHHASLTLKAQLVAASAQVWHPAPREGHSHVGTGLSWQQEQWEKPGQTLSCLSGACGQQRPGIVPGLRVCHA
jgi:hypothetical protein